MLWHGELTIVQSDNIERIQKRAFRIILPSVDYLIALDNLNMQSLNKRLENHCVDLIANLSEPDHRLHNLLPDRIADIRQRETKFRTERLKNSPLVHSINCYNRSLT